MVILEHGFEGPFKSGFWLVKDSRSGEVKKLSGKEASMISLLLADNLYQFRDDFHPLDAFTEESLEQGRAYVKVRAHAELEAGGG